MKRFFYSFIKLYKSFDILFEFAFFLLLFLVVFFVLRPFALEYRNSHYFVEIQLDSSTTVYGKSCASHWGNVECYGFDDTVYTSFLSYTWRSKEEYDLLFP